MKLYRITACSYAKDLSGEGAFLYGGRWNSKGTRLLYTAENPALAYLEALAHMTMVHQQRAYCKLILNFTLPPTQADAGDEQMSGSEKWFSEIGEEEMPDGWRSLPAPFGLKKIGDDFVKEGKFVALKIPSVIEPDNFNYLWNPAHPHFKFLSLVHNESISLDQRLLHATRF